ncbi:MAG: NifB/NifX family molybdenum-iron cluster-binding protein [Anaerolineales bacterium]|jgi:predicted Fe-Mo cluster-binding NifX family protein
MKLAITATKPDIESPLDPRFGRCAYFIVIDAGTKAWQALPNQASDARGGAATQAAHFITKHGVQAVVSGRFGPKADTALRAANIQIYEARNGKVSELFESFQAGELAPKGNHGGSERYVGRWW